MELYSNRAIGDFPNNTELFPFYFYRRTPRRAVLCVMETIFQTAYAIILIMYA